MTDHVAPERRSEIMSRINGKDTSPELLVRSLLYRMGYRFRVHLKDLPGCPDIVFSRRRKIIFVHGCFWHSHRGCKRAALPKSNVEFWRHKLSKNKERDIANRRNLKRLGWQVKTIWQCELNNPPKLERTLRVFLEGSALC
jgi:DNA mismatch endonuclease (patch repair protein)